MRGDPTSPLSRLSSEPLAARLGECEPRADAFLDQFALELGDAGDNSGKHPPVRRREIESHARNGDHRDAAGLEILKRVQQVERAPAPARQLGDEHDVATLRQRDDPLALRAVELRARSRFLDIPTTS